jgi:hypothetical protein
VGLTIRDKSIHPVRGRKIIVVAIEIVQGKIAEWGV